MLVLLTLEHKFEGKAVAKNRFFRKIIDKVLLSICYEGQTNGYDDLTSLFHC
jgi:hypothetical protein